MKESPVQPTQLGPVQWAPADRRRHVAPSADLVKDPRAAKDGDGNGAVVCCARCAVEGLGLLEDGDLGRGGEGCQEEGEEEARGAGADDDHLE